MPFFAFAPSIRKMIYNINAVEALHRILRKIIKTRGNFPTDEASLKLLSLAIKNAGIHWAAGRMDPRHGAIRHPLRSAASKEPPADEHIDLTTLIAWFAPSPSSPRACYAPLRGFRA